MQNGFEIRKVKTGESYPRNGNLHNPTPHYRYDLYLDGRLVDSSRSRKTLVKAIAEYGRDGYAE